MTDATLATAAKPAAAFSRGALILADGTVFEGHGFGAAHDGVGEVCFNTAMTGYQEILTDPSYAGQIVCFTFPHIGIVGTNDEDIEIAHAGRARPCRARRCRASVELSRADGARRLAEAAQHSRPSPASTRAR